MSQQRELPFQLCHLHHTAHLMVEGLGTPWQGAGSCIDGSLHAGEILGRGLDEGNAEMVGSGGFPAPWGHAVVLVWLQGVRKGQAWKSAFHTAETDPSPTGERHGGKLGRPPAEAWQSDSFFGSTLEQEGLGRGTGSLQAAKSSSATNSPSEMWGGQKVQSFTGGQEEAKPLNYWRPHSRGLLGPRLQTNKVFLNLTFSVKSGAAESRLQPKLHWY